MPTVKVFAGLRKLAGWKESFVAGATIRAVVMRLVEENPALEEVILSGDVVRPHFVITVNGINAIDLDLPVEEKDSIAIFPPIAGGSS